MGGRGFQMTRWSIIGATVLLCLAMQCTKGVAATAEGAGTAELAKLSAQIAHRPRDTALNLRYAQLAERLHYPRLALSAYERILSYDPENADALAGIDRVRRIIQPNTTQWLLGLGAAYESNPTNVPKGLAEGEAQFIGNLKVRDERDLDGVRWRTDGDISGTAHSYDTDLDYAYAGATTGPLLEVMPGLTAAPAIGGGASYFDGNFFYGEGVAQTTLEAYPNGAYQSIRIRGALRDYNTFFVTDPLGGYVDITGKFTFPSVVPYTSLVFTPWARWSAIEGTLGPVNPLVGVQPGDYDEFGARFDVLHSIEDWVVFGGNFSLYGRYYRDEFVAGSAIEKRSDFLLSPGASIIFPHLYQYQNTLRIDYNFLRDSSNDPTHSFIDNIVTVTALRSF
jgi:hypothetical protein